MHLTIGDTVIPYVVRESEKATRRTIVVTPEGVEAVAWYRKAAEQGYAPAQSNLGLMYDNGQGAPKDDQTGYFWMLLASAQGHRQADSSRDILAERLSPEQRAAAEASARDWKPKPATEPSNTTH